MLKFFRIPFATTGDKTAVPDDVDVDGNVSYSQGYGFDYQRQKTDPAAKNIERDKANQIYFDLTTAIAELQSQGIPDFIDSTLNGGSPYEYAANAVVRWTDNDLYVSLEAANTTDPSDATKWAKLPTAARIQSAAFTSAAAGGTVDAITAAFLPAIGALPAAPGTLSVLVRAAGANASTTPTFSPDGLTAKTIVKGNNLPLAVGDIAGAGHWLRLDFDATLDKWVLLNPATGVIATAVVTAVSDPTFVDNSGSAASTSWVRGAMSAIAIAAGFAASFTANGYVKFPSWLGGLVIQWGSGDAGSAGPTITFPIAFPTACFVVISGDVGVSPPTVQAVNSITTTNFRWYATGASDASSWVAVGK